MTFKTFAAAVLANHMLNSKSELFVVDTGDLFETYLAAFPEGTDPIYRVRTVHDCNADKNFIRRLGNLVSLNADGTRRSCWSGLHDMPYPYNEVAKRLDEVVRQAPILSVFRTKEKAFGSAPNYDNHDPSIRWEHFSGKVADRHYSTMPDKVRGERDAIAQVLRRGLDESVRSNFDDVLELIEAKALYRGEEHVAAIKAFRDLHLKYATASDKDAFVWSNLDNKNARFRNTVIGTLLTDLADGVELEKAVKKFEAKVAPENYKRPTALITPKMIDQAVATLDALGLSEAIERRYAVIEDVSVNDVLFVDNEVRGRMKGGLADLLMGSAKVKGVTLAKDPTPISIEDFMGLGAKKIELVIGNDQQRNFVSLTAPQHADAPRQLFKWDNGFAWMYDGELADTGMRDRVAAAGGRVDGPFRFTHSWNHEGRENQSLMDLHVFMPGNEHARTATNRHDSYGTGRRIGWNHRQDTLSGAKQDVDYTAAAPAGYVPIENIAFPDLAKMPEGKYICKVHNWSYRGTNRGGFKAEIELNGTIYQYDYPKPTQQKEWVTVAEITLRNGQFEIDHKIPSTSTPTTKWGVKTLTPVRVDTVMLSPNYWDGAGNVGNKHWLFMLDGCVNPEATRGFLNEYLIGSLDPHRKVFEVLSSKTKCPPSDRQLSGIGFSSTRGDMVIAIADGRSYKVQF
jgi:hypothetical protein